MFTSFEKRQVKAEEHTWAVTADVPNISMPSCRRDGTPWLEDDGTWDSDTTAVSHRSTGSYVQESKAEQELAAALQHAAATAGPGGLQISAFSSHSCYNATHTLLQQLPPNHMTSLTLKWDRKSQADSKVPAALAALTGLKELTLYTPRPKIYTAALKSLTNLSFLKFTVQGFSQLKVLSEVHSLRRLHLARTYEGCRDPVHLQNLTQITELQAKYIFEVDRNAKLPPNLKSLWTLVVDGYVGEETPNAVLAQIALHTALRHSLKEVKVTYRSRPALDHPGPEVWELLPLTQLHIKDTDGYKISAEAMQCLSSLQGLTSLIIDGECPVDITPREWIATLKCLTNLEELKLGNLRYLMEDETKEEVISWREESEQRRKEQERLNPPPDIVFMPDGSVIVDDVLIMEQLRLLQQDQPGILKDANATRQALQQLGLLPCMQPLPASYAAAAAAIPGKSAATGAERPKRSTAELDALLEKYHERLHSTSMPDGCYLGLREAVLGLPKLKSLGAFVHIDGELAGRIAQLTQLTQLDLQGCCVREAELCTMVKELTGLRALDLTYRSFSHALPQVICDHLPNLEELALDGPYKTPGPRDHTMEGIRLCKDKLLQLQKLHIRRIDGPVTYCPVVRFAEDTSHVHEFYHCY